MEKVKLPIKDVVEVIQFGRELANAFDKARLDDGKIDLRDVQHLLPVVPYFEPALADAGNVIKQLGDVDDEEFGIIQNELAKIGFVGAKPEVIEGVKVHFIAAKAIYDVFVFWKNKNS